MKIWISFWAFIIITNIYTASGNQKLAVVWLVTSMVTLFLATSFDLFQK